MWVMLTLRDSDLPRRYLEYRLLSSLQQKHNLSHWSFANNLIKSSIKLPILKVYCIHSILFSVLVLSYTKTILHLVWCIFVRYIWDFWQEKEFRKVFMARTVTFSLSQWQKTVFSENVCIVEIEHIPKAFVDESCRCLLFECLLFCVRIIANHIKSFI